MPFKPIQSTQAPHIISELRSESKHGPCDKVTALCSANVLADAAPSALLPPFRHTPEDFRASKNSPSPKEAVLQGQNRLLSSQLSPLTLSRSAAPPHLVKAALTSAQCLFPLSTWQ